MTDAVPNPIVHELLHHPKGGLRTLLCDSNKLSWQELEPDPELARAENLGVVFPTVPPDFDCSTRQLVERLSTFLEQVGIVPQDVRLAAPFLLATWVPELLEIFPTLVVVSDSSDFLPSALHAFSRLARRATTVTCQKPTSLLSLPYELCPTLIIEGTQAAPSLKHWLSVANVRGLHHFVGHRRLDPSGARIVFASEPIPASAAITVTLEGPRAAVDESTLDELQAALLGYGMRTRRQFSQFPPPASSELPLACRILQNCCWDDAALRDELATHFDDRVDLSVSSARTELRWLVLEGLDTAVQAGDASITDGELAQNAEVLAKARAEEARITAKSVGACLDQLGFKTKRGKRGYALTLDSGVKAKIAQMLKQYLPPATVAKKPASAEPGTAPGEHVNM